MDLDRADARAVAAECPILKFMALGFITSALTHAAILLVVLALIPTAGPAAALHKQKTT